MNGDASVDLRRSRRRHVSYDDTGHPPLICLGLTFHPFSQLAPPPRPWNAWLHSFAFLRLSFARVDGSLRCAIEDFAANGAEDPEGEEDLLRALAAAAEEWRAPCVFTVGGARTAVPALRWRCVVRDIVISSLQIPLAPFTVPERSRRGAFWDLAEDFEFKYVRPAPGPASVCDAIGLHFTEAFESWRHYPIAVAGILAVSAATCLAVRLMHEGSTNRADAATFIETLRDEIEGASREAPWLKTLLGDFRIRL